MKHMIGSILWLSVLLLLALPYANAFEFNGFADVSFTRCTSDDCENTLGDEGGRNGNFAIGTLDLYLAQEMEDLDVLVELVIEEGAIVDLERLTFRYTLNDALQVRAGRFHTPLGFWNTSYHHGVQLQPTINRPEFLAFEDDGGILPVHTIGAYLSGRIKTDLLAAEYGLMIGNGPKVTSEDGASNIIFPNNVSDNSLGKSVAISLALSPSILEGLKIGVSGHMARIESDGSFVPVNGISSVDVDQTIVGASFSYFLRNIDLTGEYFSIKDKDNTGNAGTNTSKAYYALISYNYADKWVPYLLYENMSVKNRPGEDPYFIAINAPDVKKGIIGLRYNISYRSSLKAEWRNVEWDDASWDEYGLQWGISF